MATNVKDDRRRLLAQQSLLFVKSAWGCRAECKAFSSVEQVDQFLHRVASSRIGGVVEQNCRTVEQDCGIIE
ncbi:MAG: hypothetical protein EBU59_10765 [Planctomycetia bacterium]|nr:hypothetical protein [Planctomycetia bacterium]